jgi:hypothetical protein
MAEVRHESCVGVSGMPSAKHELPLKLFKNTPRLIAKLLRMVFDIDVGQAPLVQTNATFDDPKLSLFSADLILEGGDMLLIVEAQLKVDKQKHFSWPLYAANAHALYKKSTWLIVITPQPAVAEWAKRPVSTLQGGSFVPLVIGPSDIPRISDPEEARNDPELAILSAIMHGGSKGGEEVALAALTAASEVAREDEDCAKLYADAVFHVLSQGTRELLEAMMKAQHYEYQSDFARKYVAEGLAKGREEGLAEGREEGLAEGREEGLVEGQVKGMHATLRALCEAFDLGWSATREQQIALLGIVELEALVSRLARERRWPL